MEQHIFFLIGLSFLLTHEMDAIKAREWRIFPLINRLDDQTGHLIFTSLHVPLYAVLFLILFDSNGLNPTLLMGFDIFFVIHLCLHVLYLKHPNNEFTSVLSWLIIVGTAVSGLLDLGFGF
ncbi:hypothetical protein QUF64_16330 [Anaerolineales bacterium HSG6]|nr:hypothetical protein [Anaerolineales bacterium HSG6]